MKTAHLSSKFSFLLFLFLLTGCAVSIAATAEADPPIATLTVSTDSPTIVVAPSPESTVFPTSTPSSTTPLVTATPATTPTQAATPAPTPTLALVVQQADRYLLVNQDEQMMHVFEQGVEVRLIPVSTGAPAQNSFTPAWAGVVGNYWGGGSFRNGFRADYMWYLFPGQWGSILIHSVPYTGTVDSKVYDRLSALGVEPVSTGCVRISPKDAQWLTKWNPVGVPITITAWSGPIGPPDESLPPVKTPEAASEVVTTSLNID